MKKIQIQNTCTLLAQTRQLINNKWLGLRIYDNTQ